MPAGKTHKMIFDISCEEKIGYTFKDKMLLRQCFTHSSYGHEQGADDNETLEFFGDAILEFVVTEYLYKNQFGDEGALTKIRADIVSKEPLLDAVYRLGIDQYLLLGVGQERNRHKEDKMYSSLYEALVAGIYLDGGLVQAKKFITNTLIKDYVKKQEKSKRAKIAKEKDAKSLLQEFVQESKIGSISYQSLSKKGPDHMPEFREAVLLNGKRIAEGTGQSKKSAQKDGASKALSRLKQGR